MSTRRLESYFWAMVGVVVTLGMTRAFLELLSKHAPSPVGGATGFAERVETFAGLQ